MNNELLAATKKAAYLLWEYMQQEEPLTIWKCVEDIACFLEAGDMLSEEDLLAVLRENVYSLEYIGFMRNISYRIYYYTGQKMAMSNWFCAEKLIGSSEWRLAMLELARLIRNGKHDAGFVSCMHNARIRDYYSAFAKRQG